MRRILKGLAIEVGNDLNGELCFEFPVASVGLSKPSFTDVMYLSPELSVAIEAKSTERTGATVREWLLQKNHSANALQVLDHWLGLIRAVTKRAERDEVQDLPYQMIHRSASLCSRESSRRVLLYQHHRLDEDESRFAPPLADLAKAIDARGSLDIWLHVVSVRRTEEYDIVRKSIQSGASKDVSSEIRRAILKGRLFEAVREEFRSF